MAFTYYWLSWVIVVITVFFINKADIKKHLLFFMGILMCIFSIRSDGALIYSLLHPILLIWFGGRFWLMKKKRLVAHFWPFMLSMVYSSIQLFIVVSPLWMEFPLSTFGIVIFLFGLTYFLKNISCAIGMWLLMSGMGMLWTTLVFSPYEMTAAIDTNLVMITSMKGILILFILYGVQSLRNWLNHLQSKKGAAHA